MTEKKQKPKRPQYYAAKAVRAEEQPMVCAWDVETDGLGGKLLMIQAGAMGDIQLFDNPTTMVDEFIEYITQYPKPAIWYAHFAQYDWRYLMDYFVEKQIDVNIGMRTETDIYEIRIETENGVVIMRDSYAIYDRPLADLAKRFAPEIPKLEIDIENFDPQNPEHREYAKRDVEILLTALPRYFDLIQDLFDVVPGATIAGTALKAWQKTLPPDEIYTASKWGETEAFIRQAYYGGLVFLTRTDTIADCETYDKNSAYPYSMLKYGVPWGGVKRTTELVHGKCAIYRCRVKSPDDLRVPILPARDARGHMRWFRGEFETTVTNNELIFAARHGYEILEIYEGLVFEETVYPFEKFISKCRHLRFEYAGSAEEFIGKLMQNSLYGKFGTRRERTALHNAWTVDEKIEKDLLPFDADGNWLLEKTFDEDMKCLPLWAVFITANTRLQLLDTIYSVGVENVIYGDTDSITVLPGHSDKFDIGREYGQWKLEKNWRTFRVIAPKVYVGELDSGELKGAVKGIPKKTMNADKWGELLRDGKTESETLSLRSLKSSIKMGNKPAFVMRRKSTDLRNAANFEVGDNHIVHIRQA